MKTYRIFVVGFSGHLHCPFELGLIWDSANNDLAQAVRFDSEESAVEYALDNLRDYLSGQHREFVVLRSYQTEKEA